MDTFLGKIYKWYKENKRDLPWRETTDPYKIWISEIILQQTRVAQGTFYYLGFIERFPTVKILAKATEDEVLKLWQGLGYYSRARNLHSAAKYIVQHLQGNFPQKYETILGLKGVGPYTAAAISSIAFGLPYPAIDGNIYRFLTRFYGISTPVDSGKGIKEIRQVALEIMPEKGAGFHNQALMEFGALQCVPKTPKCEICPLVQLCYAAQNKKVGLFPVKSKKTIQAHRYFYYYFIESGEFTFLEKRTDNDIWKNLYQFPLYEPDRILTENEILKSDNVQFFSDCNITVTKFSKSVKHVLSHQIIFARLIYVQIDNTECISSRFIKVNKKDIFKFAVPKLLEDFIGSLDFLKKNR
jgi:A/G-specific adenine glycosylase